MCCSRRTGWGGEDRSVTSSARRPTGRTVPLTHHHTAPNQACLLSVSVSVSRPPPRRLDFLDSTHPWVFAAHDVDALPPPHDAAVLAHLLHRGPDLHRAHARARLHSDFSRSHCLPPPVPPLAALVSPRKTFNFPNRKNFEYESVFMFSRAIEALGGAEVEVAAELHLARTRQSLLPAPTHYVRSFEGFRGKRGDHSLTHHTHARRDPTTLPQTIMKKSKVRLGGRPSTRTEQARQGLPPSGWTRR